MSTATNPSTANASPVALDLTVRLQAIALPEPDGRYTVLIPALPGCVSQAETLDDVAAQAIEAAEAWLETRHDRARDEAIRTARG